MITFARSDSRVLRPLGRGRKLAGMAGWHMRLWRRMRVAPGVRVNLSKSGPSISFGPRGAHLTVGRRGARETLGVPGTGLYATRTLNGPTAGPKAGEEPGAAAQLDPSAMAGQAMAAPAMVPPATAADYLAAVALGVALGIVLLWTNAVTPPGAFLSGLVTAAIGVGYEWLAHHHPVAARRMVAVAGGLLAVATAIAVAVAVIIGALALGAAATSARRRR